MGSRSLEKAKSAIETLKEECPEASNTVEAVQLDLTSDQSIENALNQVQTNQGRLDVLINNAGMRSYCRHFDSSFQLIYPRSDLRPGIPRQQGLTARVFQQGL